MRKRLTMTLALGTALAVVVAGMAAAAGNHKPVVIQKENLRVTVNGGFTPTALPKAKLAPIGLNINGKIETTDGTHPPALREFIVETDKNGAINAKGLPTCTIGKLVARETAAAKAACPTSIVGEGKTDVEIAFPEQAPITVHSKLIAFNGGVKGGVTTILIHAFLKNPVSAAVVTTVKVSKIHKGRFGTKSVALGPGDRRRQRSLRVFFELNVKRKFTYKGKSQSYLLAKCPDGHLNARGTAVFSDGKELSGEVVRPCTPKG